MSDLTNEDVHWLDAAARIATPWLGSTAETPTVGALVVDEVRQVVLGRGVTSRGGRPHAEPQALQQAGGKARGRTLYVTLEPCNHWDKTPPCADAVIRAGIRRVVVGVNDPDPRTAGEGVARMLQAGIDVVVAGHKASARLHEGFLSRHIRGRPFVTAKLAVSIDGKIGAADQARYPITGVVAQRWAHMQRAMSDVVMVGGRTATIDDPRLTVRLPGLEDRLYMRVILMGTGPINPRIELISGVSPYSTMIIAADGVEFKVPPQVEVVNVPGRNGRPDLGAALTALGARGFGRVFIEPGARLTEALLGGDLVDRFHILTGAAAVGPKGIPATILGGIEGRVRAAGLSEVDRQSLGDDKLTTFERL